MGRYPVGARRGLIKTTLRGGNDQFSKPWRHASRGFGSAVVVRCEWRVPCPWRWHTVLSTPHTSSRRDLRQICVTSCEEVSAIRFAFRRVLINGGVAVVLPINIERLALRFAIDASGLPTCYSLLSSTISPPILRLTMDFTFDVGLSLNKLQLLEGILNDPDTIKAVNQGNDGFILPRGVLHNHHDRAGDATNDSTNDEHARWSGDQQDMNSTSLRPFSEHYDDEFDAAVWMDCLTPTAHESHPQNSYSVPMTPPDSFDNASATENPLARASSSDLMSMLQDPSRASWSFIDSNTTRLLHGDLSARSQPLIDSGLELINQEASGPLGEPTFQSFTISDLAAPSYAADFILPPLPNQRNDQGLDNTLSSASQWFRVPASQLLPLSRDLASTPMSIPDQYFEDPLQVSTSSEGGLPLSVPSTWSSHYNWFKTAHSQNEATVIHGNYSGSAYSVDGHIFHLGMARRHYYGNASNMEHGRAYQPYLQPTGPSRFSTVPGALKELPMWDCVSSLEQRWPEMEEAGGVYGAGVNAQSQVGPSRRPWQDAISRIQYCVLSVKLQVCALCAS